MSRFAHVLITGANGLLGQNLARAFDDCKSLTLTDLHPAAAAIVPGAKYVSADLSDRAQVEGLMHTAKPSLVLHAASMTNVDTCEEQPRAAHRANVVATENLVNTMPRNGRFLYVSTDYVFDGAGGPYREEDVPNPIGVYGKTKLEGEQIVSTLADYLIVRTIVLYGTGHKLRPLFPDWVLGKLALGEPFRVVDDQTGNTTLASNLASICRALSLHGEPGTYHAAGVDIVSRFDFARSIADQFGFSSGMISACKTMDIAQKASRPLRSGFVLDKIRKVPGVELLSLRGQLDRYKEEKQRG